MSPEVREVLRKVRDEVLTSEERWTQGAWNSTKPELPCCLDGALGRATGWTDTAYKAYEDAYAQLCHRLNVVSLVAWNDAPERTFADIRDLLDKALAEPTTGASA